MTTPSKPSIAAAPRRSGPSYGSAPASGSAPSIKSARAELLARTDLVGPELRAALTAMFDAWLTEILPPAQGIALLAVGGLGRREPTPYVYLDLVLLHDGKADAVDLALIADSVWYPIWDAGLKLGESLCDARERDGLIHRAAGLDRHCDHDLLGARRIGDFDFQHLFSRHTPCPRG